MRRERKSRLATEAQTLWLENYYMSANDRQKLIDRSLDTMNKHETTKDADAPSIKRAHQWASVLAPLVSTFLARA